MQFITQEMQGLVSVGDQSEDCLRLNIFVPAKLPSKPLPTMVRYDQRILQSCSSLFCILVGSFGRTVRWTVVWTAGQSASGIFGWSEDRRMAAQSIGQSVARVVGQEFCSAIGQSGAQTVFIVLVDGLRV